MAKILQFNFQLLLPIIQNTLKATVFRPSYNEAYNSDGSRKPDLEIKTGPALWLVKDSGAYLMSNAVIGKEKGATNPVVYAICHNPHMVGYDYEYTRQVCGGDDFCDVIPLHDSFLELMKEYEAKKRKALFIELTDTDFRIYNSDFRFPNS